MQVSISEIKIGKRYREPKPDDVQTLAKSIQEVGRVITPVLLTEDYTLVDGHHRIQACKLLGWETIPATVDSFTKEEAELFEIDTNLKRFELDFTVLDKGELLNRREELLDALGMRAPSHRPSKTEKGDVPVTLFKTTKELGEEIGVSEKTAQTYKQIDRNLTPEVKALIRNTPLADKREPLLALSRKAPEEQKAIAEVIISGAVATVREAEEIIAPPPDLYIVPNKPAEVGAYEVIYADLNLTKDMKNPLKGFDIAENATLFLWALEPKLDIAMDLGRAWGFKYRTSFIWDKRFDTAGPYHQRNHAHLLVFVKGKHEPVLRKPDWGSIWTQQAETFDTRPEAFRDIVYALFDGKAVLEI